MSFDKSIRETSLKSYKMVVNGIDDPTMKKKNAIIIIELVDESILQNNNKISQEIVEWFQTETTTIPWAKDLKNVTIKE